MNYPAPTHCPSCGVREATAVCRWCGCWKFGARAVDAAMRSILARKWWMVLAVVALYALVGTLDFESAKVIEEEARVRAAAAAHASVAALYADQAPATQIWLMNPICPDQWVAQRSAGPWHVRCVIASTEGSRVAE